LRGREAHFLPLSLGRAVQFWWVEKWKARKERGTEVKVKKVEIEVEVEVVGERAHSGCSPKRRSWSPWRRCIHSTPSSFVMISGALPRACESEAWMF
jgi:hypothetical protein